MLASNSPGLIIPFLFLSCGLLSFYFTVRSARLLQNIFSTWKFRRQFSEEAQIRARCSFKSVLKRICPLYAGLTYNSVQYEVPPVGHLFQFFTYILLVCGCNFYVALLSEDLAYAISVVVGLLCTVISIITSIIMHDSFVRSMNEAAKRDIEIKVADNSTILDCRVRENSENEVWTTFIIAVVVSCMVMILGAVFCMYLSIVASEEVVLTCFASSCISWLVDLPFRLLVAWVSKKLNLVEAYEEEFCGLAIEIRTCDIAWMRVKESFDEERNDSFPNQDLSMPFECSGKYSPKSGKGKTIHSCDIVVPRMSPIESEPEQEFSEKPPSHRSYDTIASHNANSEDENVQDRIVFGYYPKARSPIKSQFSSPVKYASPVKKKENKQPAFMYLYEVSMDNEPNAEMSRDYFTSDQECGLAKSSWNQFIEQNFEEEKESFEESVCSQSSERKDRKSEIIGNGLDLNDLIGNSLNDKTERLPKENPKFIKESIESPNFVYESKETPTLEKISKESPTNINKLNESPTLAIESKESPNFEKQSKESPYFEIESEECPNFEMKSKESPNLVKSSKESPTLIKTPKESSSIIKESKQSSPSINESKEIPSQIIEPKDLPTQTEPFEQLTPAPETTTQLPKFTQNINPIKKLSLSKDLNQEKKPELDQSMKSSINKEHQNSFQDSFDKSEHNPITEDYRADHEGDGEKFVEHSPKKPNQFKKPLQESPANPESAQDYLQVTDSDLLSILQKIPKFKKNSSILPKQPKLPPSENKIGKTLISLHRKLISFEEDLEVRPTHTQLISPLIFSNKSSNDVSAPGTHLFDQICKITENDEVTSSQVSKREAILPSEQNPKLQAYEYKPLEAISENQARTAGLGLLKSVLNEEPNSKFSISNKLNPETSKSESSDSESNLSSYSSSSSSDSSSEPYKTGINKLSSRKKMQVLTSNGESEDNYHDPDLKYLSKSGDERKAVKPPYRPSRPSGPVRPSRSNESKHEREVLSSAELKHRSKLENYFLVNASNSKELVKDKKVFDKKNRKEILKHIEKLLEVKENDTDDIEIAKLKAMLASRQSFKKKQMETPKDTPYNQKILTFMSDCNTPVEEFRLDPQAVKKREERLKRISSIYSSKRTKSGRRKKATLSPSKSDNFMKGTCL